jgi:ribonucleotide monophosphatase NagD (HAD superfamily)
MSAVICDIDGTILFGKRPIQRTIDYLKELDQRYQIFIVTARPSSRREETIKTLKELDVPFHRLIMNDTGNSHKDGLESKRTAAESILFVQRVVVAIDNDLGARRVYASLKIKTLDPRKILPR